MYIFSFQYILFHVDYLGVTYCIQFMKLAKQTHALGFLAIANMDTLGLSGSKSSFVHITETAAVTNYAKCVEILGSWKEILQEFTIKRNEILEHFDDSLWKVMLTCILQCSIENNVQVVMDKAKSLGLNKMLTELAATNMNLDPSFDPELELERRRNNGNNDNINAGNDDNIYMENDDNNDDLEEDPLSDLRSLQGL